MREDACWGVVVICAVVQSEKHQPHMLAACSVLSHGIPSQWGNDLDFVVILPACRVCSRQERGRSGEGNEEGVEYLEVTSLCSVWGEYLEETACPPFPPPPPECACTNVRSQGSTPLCFVTSASTSDKVIRQNYPPGWSIISKEECVECCCLLLSGKGKQNPWRISGMNDDVAGSCFQNHLCHNPAFEGSALLWFGPRLSGQNSPACGFIVLCPRGTERMNSFI